MFNTVCLDREVLQLAIRARCDISADEPDYSTQSYRKAAYRQYTLWKFGKLGRGNRKILPSCVVIVIRQAYPAPDGNKTLRSVHFGVVVVEQSNCKCGGIVRNQIW